MPFMREGYLVTFHKIIKVKYIDLFWAVLRVQTDYGLAAHNVLSDI